MKIICLHYRRRRYLLQLDRRSQNMSLEDGEDEGEEEALHLDTTSSSSYLNHILRVTHRKKRAHAYHSPNMPLEPVLSLADTRALVYSA